LHWDHVIGLPFFAGARDPAASISVFGPACGDGGGGFRRSLDQVISPPGFPIDTSGFAGRWTFEDLGDETIDLGSFRVTARSVRHRGYALGFRVEHDGSSIAYLSDHGPGAEDRGTEEDDLVPDHVLDLVDGVDVLFHDAQYTDADYARLRHFGHTTPSYAVRVAAAGKVATLHLYHHDPARTDEGVDEMLDTARRAAGELGFSGEVRAAAEGDRFTLGSTSPTSQGGTP
jgi:ribonuclease BN (tRNA processing enzyme)